LGFFGHRRQQRLGGKPGTPRSQLSLLIKMQRTGKKLAFRIHLRKNLNYKFYKYNVAELNYI
jgi:hypothetical protein